MSITNSAQMPSPPLMRGPQVNLPANDKPKTTQHSALKEANSAEEKAIAVSSALSKELSKGDKKNRKSGDAAKKRIKLIEKITSFSKLNISNSKIDERAAQIKGQLKAGHNLIKDILDSQGGEAMLAFAAFSSLEKSEDPESEIGIEVAKYIELMENHKNKTIASWVNTSASIAESTLDKDMAFQVQSMLANSSENSLHVRSLLRSIIEIGGEHQCDDVQLCSIRALAADMKSGAASADLATLAKTLSTLSNIESVSSMYKLADEQLIKLSNGEGNTPISSSDYLGITLDISTNPDPIIVTSYSIAVLDPSPKSEYLFATSIAHAFSQYPQNVWEDQNERQQAIDSISVVLHRLSDATKHAESNIKNMLFK